MCAYIYISYLNFIEKVGDLFRAIPKSGQILIALNLLYNYFAIFDSLLFAFILISPESHLKLSQIKLD